MVALVQTALWWLRMSHRQYAFVNDAGIVVQVIAGELSEQQQEQFLRDYAVLYGASQIVAVEPDTAVWIGGSYTDDQFLPPIEQVVVDGTSEELLPPEVTSDPIAG